MTTYILVLATYIAFSNVESEFVWLVRFLCRSSLTEVVRVGKSLFLHIIGTMATIHPKQSTGDITTFNIQHGFAEGLLRGMRSSFLKDSDYHHLTQCETLDDVKLNLTETDYAEALADSNAITPAAFQKVAVDKVGQVVVVE
eukprot:scaffold2322_cov135-Cylindrotheca_fusiformis.AAC.32